MPPTIDAPADVPSFPPPAGLVGRGTEWSRLTTCLAGALRGAGGLATVTGEAGVGKTALVEALADVARGRGALVLSGGCYDLAFTQPYGPWREALAGYRLVGELPPLPDAFVNSSAAVDSSEALFEQVRLFLAKVAAKRPFLLILEDLHWSDAASLELVRTAARRMEDPAPLIVLTWRDDEPAAPRPLDQLLPALVREVRPQRIVPRRLDVGEMRDLVAGRYRLPPEECESLAGWVQQHADGNPFFAGEVLLALEQGGALREDGESWRFRAPAQFSVPLVVRQVIERRLALLSESTQRVLEYAAIVGQEASLDVVQVAAKANEDDLAAALDEAIAARLVVATDPSGSGLRFRHALVRETLYERQALFRRRARHRRVAETLLDRPSPAPLDLGFHFQAAHDPRAIPWLTTAGERSLALYAPHDAIAHLTRAEEVAARHGLALPADALRTRGRAWELGGDHDRARADFVTALRLARDAGDRRGEWRALLDLGALWAERDYGRAGEAYRSALALAQQMGDDVAVAHNLNALGNWHVNQDDPRSALAYHQQALEIFSRTGDRQGVAESLDLLAMAHYIAADAERAANELERAVSLLEEIGDRKRLASALTNWAATGCNYEFDAAVVAPRPLELRLNALDRARDVAREIGWLAGEVYAELVAGEVVGPCGLIDRALAHLRSSLSMAERIGHRQWATASHFMLGRLYADLLDTDSARDHLAAALSQSRAIESRIWITLSLAALGSLLIETGDLDGAAAVLEPDVDPDRPADSICQRFSRLSWARLQTARGEPEAALTAIDLLIASAPNGAGPRSLPWLALARGDALMLLDRYDEAEVAYDAARDGAVACDYAHLRWRSERELARLWRRRVGRVADAEAALHRALTAVQAIAETMPAEERAAYLARVVATFPESGTLPAATAVPGGLSPREIDVLRLVAQGLTDAQVGERLAISRRTVGRHLESVYNKLGVGSRTAAVAFAFEHDLVSESRSG